MESTEIKKLIEAFYLAETSKEEEQALFEYFQEETVDNELQAHKAFFMQMHQLKNNTACTTTLGAKMETLFESLNKKEKQTKVRKLWISLGKVAAVLLIATTTTLLVTHKADNSIAFAERPLTEDDCLKIEVALTMIVETLEEGVAQQLEIIAENLALTSQALNSITN